MKKRLSVPLLLCAALLVYAMVSPSPRLVPRPPVTVDDTPVPESYAYGVTVQQFSGSGALQDTTDARELRRYANTGLMELEQPRRHSYDQGGEWVATASRGTLDERNDRFDLEEAVRVSYPGENVQFHSESLIISLSKRTARSPSEVRILQDNSETRADQLYLNLNRQIATISGSVHSVYVPER